MSPNKRHQKKKGVQTQDFSFDEKLRTLNANDLYNLVQNLVKRDPDIYRLVLEWLKETSEDLKKSEIKKEVVPLNDELLMEYWKSARDIISEFNEYGGGPEEEEEEAYDWLNKISDLIKEGSISTEAKFEFLDDAFEEYNVGNSGFEDSLMEIFFDICKSKKEWKYLVKKLEEEPSEWRRDKIMEIQKDQLRDDDAYLKIRMKDLKYGMDYWDLAGFYIGKGDMQKAVETAEEGLIKGEGWISKLLEFLFEYYAKNKDTVNLERIVQHALMKKSDEKAMLDRLFEYHRAQDDYENAKSSLLKAFEYVKGDGYISEVRSYAHYNKMKMFLAEADWKGIEPKIIREVREKDLEDYLRICLDKNMEKEVMHILLNPPKKQPRTIFRLEQGYNFDEFANRLKEEFPEDVIKYYRQKAYSNIRNGNRGTYVTAAEYLVKVKHIYTEILNDESKWKQCFKDLKEKFKRRPAFLDEVKGL